MRLLPISVRSGDQTVTTTLDGTTYQLRFRWNGRLSRWFFDLSTAAGTPLIQGKLLAVGADLLRQIRHDDRAPQGFLVAMDTVGRQDAGFRDLGVRHQIGYFGVTEGMTDLAQTISETGGLPPPGE